MNCTLEIYFLIYIYLRKNCPKPTESSLPAGFDEKKVYNKTTNASW